MLFILLFLGVVVVVELDAATPTSAAVVIVNQSAPARVQQHQRLPCYQFTDEPGAPILQAADDFVLPDDGLPNVTGLLFSFTVARTRNWLQQTPRALVLSLLYNDETRDAPGELFFRKTVHCYAWNDATIPIEQHALELSMEVLSGDPSDHSANETVRFAVHDQSWLPRGQRLWVSLYAVGERNFVLSPRTENALYWLTAAESASGASQCYYYRDSGDLLQRGLSAEWSNASFVETKRGVQSGALDMAWRLTLVKSGGPTANNNSWLNGAWWTPPRAIAVSVSSAAALLGIILLCITCVVYRRHVLAKKKKAGVPHSIKLHSYPRSDTWSGSNNDGLSREVYYQEQQSQQQQQQDRPGDHGWHLL